MDQNRSKHSYTNNSYAMDCDRVDAKRVAVAENEDTSYVGKVAKRRSSVFQSRSLALIPDNPGEVQTVEVEENAPAEGTNRREALCDHLPEREFKLEQYVLNLREERKLWQNLLRDRKAERRELARRKASVETESSAVDFGLLSKEERAFVAVPATSYDEISEQLRDLAEKASTVASLNQVACWLNKGFLAEIETETNNVKTAVIVKSV